MRWGVSIPGPVVSRAWSRDAGGPIQPMVWGGFGLFDCSLLLQLFLIRLHLENPPQSDVLCSTLNLNINLIGFFFPFPPVHLSPVKLDGKMLVSSRSRLPHVTSVLASIVIFFFRFHVRQLGCSKDLQHFCFFHDIHPLLYISPHKHTSLII